MVFTQRENADSKAIVEASLADTLMFRHSGGPVKSLHKFLLTSRWIWEHISRILIKELPGLGTRSVFIVATMIRCSISAIGLHMMV
ncbi:hypothetical protein NG42_04085 [Winslowiella iniecta]|uniref:Uncharacterized protein n=1 Tax=Winslowiella iniecta TaxID=1560201 RepID=A0A0L7THX9_9GAMM|nr:hypothetical protein NG42_04085 [Winslowiella iniecta]KOC94940.1 hypothetical protein NG43_01625 [Winslowiella iniecta]